MMMTKRLCAAIAALLAIQGQVLGYRLKGVKDARLSRRQLQGTSAPLTRPPKTQPPKTPEPKTKAPTPEPKTKAPSLAPKEAPLPSYDAHHWQSGDDSTLKRASVSRSKHDEYEKKMKGYYSPDHPSYATGDDDKGSKGSKHKASYYSPDHPSYATGDDKGSKESKYKASYYSPDHQSYATGDDNGSKGSRSKASYKGTKGHKHTSTTKKYKSGEKEAADSKKLSMAASYDGHGGSYGGGSNKSAKYSKSYSSGDHKENGKRISGTHCAFCLKL
jgi:hypothetical protein